MIDCGNCHTEFDYDPDTAELPAGAGHIAVTYNPPHRLEVSRTMYYCSVDCFEAAQTDRNAFREEYL